MVIIDLGMVYATHLFPSQNSRRWPSLQRQPFFRRHPQCLAQAQQVTGANLAKPRVLQRIIGKG